MSNCMNCGAPLPAKSLICPYCKTRHDVDLKGIHRHTLETPESDRHCPRCHKPMPTIDLKIGEKFLIERCTDCMGLFFDPGELEALLEKSVSHVYDVDYSRIEELKNLKRHQDYPVTYIKCPVCQKLMNRINFGAQSGVIVDKCRYHGVWLDGGELRHLMDWTKAGGKIHHERKQLEMEKLEIQREKENTRRLQTTAGSSSFGADLSGGHDRIAGAEDWGILTSLSRLVGKLF